MKAQSILLGLAAALSASPVLAKTTTTAAASTSTSTALSNEPSEEPHIGQITNQGCFNSSSGMTLINENLDFNTDGKCGQECQDQNYYVGATHAGQECWCGNEYPPAGSLVADSECNFPCTGYADRACGGTDAWSVYNTGIKLAVSNHDASSESSTATASAGATQTSSSAAQSSSASSSGDSGSSSKTVGIAVGVVAAVVVVGGAVGVVLWYLRKKRNQEIEEEHRRNAAVNAFINGSNPPGSSHGSISMTDSRLDPIMAHRRLSDGSIADNEDYSRKILRVTNA